jgi:hypothetical protein
MIFLVLLLIGCSPITRLEHGRTDLFGPTTDYTSQYAYVEQGVRLQKGEFAVDFMAGPIAQWSDNKEYETGINLNPRFFWFFSDQSFFHLEADFAFYEEEEVIFLFLVFEKVW